MKELLNDSKETQVFVVTDTGFDKIGDKQYGHFFEEECYVVLTTRNLIKPKKKCRCIHVWVGEHCPDSKTRKALIACNQPQLQTRVLYRETQYHESSVFFRYFPIGLTYHKGKIYKNNEEEVGRRILWRLFGCHHMRVEEVPIDKKYLSMNDSYVLEANGNIFMMISEIDLDSHRNRVIKIVKRIHRDKYGEKADVLRVEKVYGVNDNALLRCFFKEMNMTSLDEVTEMGSPLRATITRDYTWDDRLYKCISKNPLNLEAVPKPLAQEQLKSNSIYLVSNSECVYMWVGAAADDELKTHWFEITDKYLESGCKWFPVTKIHEGFETVEFKLCFDRWQVDPDMAREFLRDDEFDGGYEGDITDEMAIKLAGKCAFANNAILDEGYCFRDISRLLEEDRSINISNHYDDSYSMVFYQSEVYGLKYEYSEWNNAVHLWTGKDASDDELISAQQWLRDRRKDSGRQIAFDNYPGCVSKHLLRILDGKLTIMLGNSSDNYAPRNFNKNYNDNGVRLFKVSGTKIGLDMLITQVRECEFSLDNDHVFVLELEGVVYVRVGKESLPAEKETAAQFAASLEFSSCSVKIIKQGEEPRIFWKVLGNKTAATDHRSRWLQRAHRRVNWSPRLVSVTLSIDCKVVLETIADYQQTDLDQCGTFFLDNWEEIYFFMNNMAGRIKPYREAIMQQFIKQYGRGRTRVNCVLISFTMTDAPYCYQKLFPTWDPYYWDNYVYWDENIGDLLSKKFD